MSNYVEELAEVIHSLVNPEVLPDENSRILFRIYAVLAIAKGPDVTAEDVHAAWAAWMTSVDPNHISLVPFDQLDFESKAADMPYVEAIRIAAERYRLAKG